METGTGSTTRRRVAVLGSAGAALLVSWTLSGCAAAPDGGADSGTGATTSAPTTAAPATGPARAPDCSDAALEADLGELGFSACSGEWASIAPRAYTDVCTDCESAWLARWDGFSWRLVAQCYAYTILTADENGCGAVEGSFPDPTPSDARVTVLPPPEVACAIWGYNTLEENLATTGCSPG